MSEPSSFKDFQSFVKGEIRVDGWISDWRRDFEAYMHGKTVVPMSPQLVKQRAKTRTGCRLKGQSNSEYMAKRRAKALSEGMCPDCYHAKARAGKTTCQPCQDKRTAREVKRHNARKLAKAA